MGRTGTLVSILTARMSEERVNIPDIVFELRRRRHKYLVVESWVKLKYTLKLKFIDNLFN